jgi:hypothetical protein
MDPHTALNTVLGSEILGESYTASLCDGYSFNDPWLVVGSSCKAVLHPIHYMPRYARKAMAMLCSLGGCSYVAQVRLSGAP